MSNKAITILESHLVKLDLLLSSPEVSVGLITNDKENHEVVHIRILREHSVKLCAVLMNHYNICCNEIAEAMNIPGRSTGCSEDS